MIFNHIAFLGIFMTTLFSTANAQMKLQAPTPTKVKKDSKGFDFNAQSSIQYKRDQLRERVNESETNITNLSLNGTFHRSPEERIRLEILGEESQVTDEFNLSVGELYYQNDRSYINYTAGFMKLKYGILNPIDGNFNKMPSYYDFLYNLPRGIDVGMFTETDEFMGFSVGLGGYFGRSIRETDGFQPEPENLPFHTYLKYAPYKNLSFKFHYFEKSYETLPLTRGYGLDMLSYYRFKDFDLSFNAEIWSLRLDNTSIDSEALAYTLMPKIGWKKVYYQPILSNERWSESIAGSTEESYTSHRLGYALSENFILEVEHLSVSSQEIQKEDALQGRLYLTWDL